MIYEWAPSRGLSEILYLNVVIVSSCLAGEDYDVKNKAKEHPEADVCSKAITIIRKLVDHRKYFMRTSLKEHPVELHLLCNTVQIIYQME